MPFPLVALIISVAFTFLGELLTPHNNAKPTPLSDFNIPTATEDRPKPLFVGTVRHKSPNCTWYGDYSAEPIKVRAGLFTKVTIGYKYRLGFQLNLGWGPLDELTQIRMNDKPAWVGSLTAPGAISIRKGRIFGGDTAGGNGGFIGRGDVYFGDGLQTADPYLVAKSGPTPAYKNDTYIVFSTLSGPVGSKGAYVGNQPQLPEMSLDVRRCPNQLGVTGGKHIIDTKDANPVCALYEFMTQGDNRFGGGYSSAQFNLDNWLDAAERVYDEGLGISRLWDSAEDVDRVMSDYLQLLDAVINVNMTTGKFELVLVRDDYDPETIPSFNEDNVLEVVDFKHGQWAETYNEVKLSYLDRNQEFEPVPIGAQDGANSAGMAEVRSTFVDIKGLTNAVTANKVTFRELRVLSHPLSTVTLKITRAGFSLYGGGVFKWSNAKYGIVNMILRVAEIDGGTPDSNAMTVTAIQDVFSLGETAYEPPEPPDWTPPPSYDAENIEIQQALEAPKFFNNFEPDSCEVIVMACPVNDEQTGYDLYSKVSTAPGYNLDPLAHQSDVVFTPTGVLVSDYASSEYDTSATLTITPTAGMGNLPVVVSDDERQRGAGLLLIDNEILSYDSYAIIDGDYVFDGVYGGLLDTVLASHSDGARVWFIGNTFGWAGKFYHPVTVNTKAASVTPFDAIELEDCTELSVTTVQRAVKPYPPARLTLTQNALPASGFVTLEWADRYRYTARVVTQLEPPEPVEPGQTHTVNIYGEDGSTLLRTITGVTGISLDYDSATELADAGSIQDYLTFTMHSVRDGYVSQTATKTISRI